MKTSSARTLSLCLLLASFEIVLAAPSFEVAGDTLRSHRHLRTTIVEGRSSKAEINPKQSIQGKELQALGTTSVAEAIRQFAGIQVKDYGGIGGLKTVNIRSLGAQHVGIFYDGMELGNAQNGQVDLGRFSPDNLEALSVYNAERNGQLLSANELASASTVYLQTRKPVFPEAKKRNLRFSLKSGTIASVRPAIVWEERLNPHLLLSLSAEYLYASGKYKFRYQKAGGYDTTAVRQNSDVNALRAEVNLFGRLQKGDWQSKVYIYNSERGLPGSVVRGRFWQDDRQSDNNFFVQSALRKLLGQRYTLQAKLKYANDYLHYRSIPSALGSSMPADNRFRQNELYLSLAHKFSIAPHYTFSAASDYRYNQSSSDAYNYAAPRRHTTLLSASGNISYSRFKLQANVLASFINDHANAKRSARQELTPSLSLFAHPFRSRAFSLNTFYKRIFRMPTLNDLYYRIVGNTNLLPERADQYDIGFSLTPRTSKKGALRSFALKTDFYYNTVRDKIVAIPTSNQFRWTMYNLGKVEILGVDVNMQSIWQLGPAELDFHAAYTFQSARNVTSKRDNYYGHQIAYAPKHSGSASASLFWEGWLLRYALLAIGERYAGHENIPMNHMPRWSTSDLHLAKSLQIIKTHCTFSVEINNIFNRHYEVVQGYPMPGISAIFGIKVEL